jgi:hypothetical protein
MINEQPTPAPAGLAGSVNMDFSFSASFHMPPWLACALLGPLIAALIAYLRLRANPRLFMAEHGHVHHPPTCSDRGRDPVPRGSAPQELESVKVHSREDR